VARRAKLTQLARLLDLPQDVLEEVALGVGVRPVEAEAVEPGSPPA
jgi:hypothetical protein